MNIPTRRSWLAVTAALLNACSTVACAEVLPTAGSYDARIRIAAYNPEQVYRLYGFIGYQIDLEFEPGEHFVGLAAGDIEGISFVAEDNHLFLKPKATQVGTNLTVLTTRRHYQFEYSASSEPPSRTFTPVTYALRFTYPPMPGREAEARIEHGLENGVSSRAHNIDYWYCGKPTLKPIAAFDDGVHTYIRFSPRAEMPALFVRNEDGSESLLNFSVQDGQVIVHRVARQFILRRGRLTGCIVNQGYGGSGERLPSGTVSDQVERAVRDEQP